MTVIKDTPNPQIGVVTAGQLLLSGAAQAVETAPIIEDVPRPSDRKATKPRRPSPPGCDISGNVYTVKPNSTGALAVTAAPPRPLGLFSANPRAPPGPLPE
jgi:hypothetical protein